MVATDLFANTRDGWAGLMVLSGTLVAGARWRPAFHENLRGRKVFQSHGRQDPILPFGVAEELHALLVANGAEVDWAPFNGPHAIPPTVCARAGTWARSVLG